MQFLDFALDPDRQAELSNLSVDAPTNVNAMSKVDPAIGKWLPDVASRTTASPMPSGGARTSSH